jgi:FkbM family methyltransferase
MKQAARVTKAIRRLRYRPRIDTFPAERTIRLGSAYGGWVFLDRPELNGSTIVSCGLGEDASFDLEFARRYRARVVIVDPTPRAIEHYSAIIRHLGMPRTTQYADTGSQLTSSYELRDIGRSQLRLVPKALSDEAGVVRFYSPPDAASVSHSIINFQNGYSTSTPFIEVPSVDWAALLTQERLHDAPLAKFDIEGAETLVLPAVATNPSRPAQILVEFDELNFPSGRALESFSKVHEVLMSAGYRAFYFDGRSCVSYALSEIL